MRYLLIAALATVLTACAPADIAVNTGKLAWCEVDEVGYLAEVDGHDIHFALELVGVWCD